MSKQVSAVLRYDFRVTYLREDDAEIIEMMLDDVARKWVFQHELGERTAHNHFQGRLTLKVKERGSTLIKKMRKYLDKGDEVRSIYLAPTSKENADNDYYVTKEDTRIGGPWRDGGDKVKEYMPRQIRELVNNPDFKWKPWQQYVLDSIKIFDVRHINVIIDNKGHIGKTSLKIYGQVTRQSKILPMVNDMKDMLRMVMDMPKVGCYIIDMPRAIKKEKLFGLYMGIESTKDGYAFDDRYAFKDECFDSPVIWVFCNTCPDLTLLSKDRWLLWEVDADDQLVPFVDRIPAEKKVKEEEKIEIVMEANRIGILRDSLAVQFEDKDEVESEGEEEVVSEGAKLLAMIARNKGV